MNVVRARCAIYNLYMIFLEILVDDFVDVQTAVDNINWLDKPELSLAQISNTDT